MVSPEQVKALRERTGISIMQCKKALEEGNGDIDEALTYLKEQGIAVAQKKQNRDLSAGVVGSYVHGTGDIGAMVELLCETDFVAKNEEFKQLARDIAMHLSASPAGDKDELLSSEYIKNTDQTIADLLQGAIQKFGEKTDIGKFERFSILGR
tara:strand:- start:6284 stop:6742 length:459 start_codon:yes stop_codon:yes gene_type:complete